GEVTDQLAEEGRGIRREEGEQAEEKEEGEQTEGDDGGDDLILRERRGKAADGEVEHARKGHHQVAPPVGGARIRSGSSGDALEEDEVKERGRPEDEEEEERPEELGEDDLPIPHRSRHEHINGAHLELLGEGPHGDGREDEDEADPE